MVVVGLNGSKMTDYAINDLDNAIYEIDMYAPMAFFDVERQLAPIIKRSPKKGDDFQ